MESPGPGGEALPGILQGVRLSRKFPDGSVLQPQVMDEVVQIIAHTDLGGGKSNTAVMAGSRP